MCRLFGSRSLLPIRAAHELVDAPNALRSLSAEHMDGWGIGWWPDERSPVSARGIEAAKDAPEFARLACTVESRALIAHVRKASVGGVHLDNSHPFGHGSWLFAHNGTIARFADVRADLEAAIDPAFRPLVTGETDSARCFGIFLSRLSRLSSLDGDPPVERVARALAETVAVVAEIADAPDREPSATTFLAGNGRTMLACRRGRTLFHATRARGVDAAGDRVERLLVSSERPSDAWAWEEVPLDGIVGVDGDMRLHRSNLADWAIPSRRARAG